LCDAPSGNPLSALLISILAAREGPGLGTGRVGGLTIATRMAAWEVPSLGLISSISRPRSTATAVASPTASAISHFNQADDGAVV